MRFAAIDRHVRITFVLPKSASGGTLVIKTYARFLAGRGHRVVLVSPPEPERRPWLSWTRRLLSPKLCQSTIDDHGIEHRVLERSRPIVDADVPDADVVIATWWETAEWVSVLSDSRGRKCHFVQGYEVYPWLPQQRARAVYRLPLRRIVISQWLADIIRSSYGDGSAVLVLNGVDHDEFHAVSRSKQKRPTVGFLYSEVPFKNLDASLVMLESLKTRLPDLRVLTFGFESPGRRLPSYVEFVTNPPRPNLREIYASCDVWISASTSEGFNMPTSEAMACRTPVVAFPTGWPAHALVSGVNGECVELGDFAAFERATERLLRFPEEDWRRCSAQAYETARHLSWERSGLAFERALANLYAA